MNSTSAAHANTIRERSPAGVARQTVEFGVFLSLCILLFRTFVAEAYIVPTGSMAPTLLGNHREVTCPNCGIRFPLGHDQDDRAGRAVCPNCGANDLDNAPAVACVGDRVLVQKLLYDFRPPRRWEVAVFQFPNEPSMPYVKRVVGLPNEAVQIVGGDVYADGKIARKTLKEQRALRVLVYDHNHKPRDHEQFPRWEAKRSRSGLNHPSLWRPVGSRFGREAPAGDDGALDWLEYHHWDPDRGKFWPVYDFNAYNGGDFRGENRVNDLMFEARLAITRPIRQLALRINSGSDRFLVTISDDGSHATVSVRRAGDGSERLSRTGASLLRVGTYRLEASVMDRRLTVALEGRLLFDPLDYDDPVVGPGPGDRPVALGVRGGALTVSDLRVWRDVHYTSALAHTPRRPFAVDTPYPLGADEFFVLGDNSPVSNDSRFWDGSPVIPGALFLGKPFLVHLPGQVVPLQVWGRSVYWVPDPREIRYIR